MAGYANSDGVKFAESVADAAGLSFNGMVDMTIHLGVDSIMTIKATYIVPLGCAEKLNKIVNQYTLTKKND
jgi:hypothetical protein